MSFFEIHKNRERYNPDATGQDTGTRRTLRKITLISSAPAAMATLAMRAALVRENVCDAAEIIDTGDLDHLNQYAGDGFSGYIMILVNDHSRCLLHSYIDKLNRSSRRSIIFLTFIDLSYEEVKAYCKQCYKLAIIDQAATAAELKAHIEELHVKEFVICKRTQNMLLSDMTSDSSKNKELSSKQRRIIELYEKGFSIQQTAEQLQLSAHTVAAYRSRIIKKFNTRSMAEVVFLLKSDKPGSPNR